MNLLRNLISKKKQNPYYKKLNQSLTRQGFSIKIKNAYFLFGIPYNDSSIKEIKQAVIDNNLDELKMKRPYNVSVDNIELYLLEETNNSLSIVLLLDYFDVYLPEYILEILPAKLPSIDNVSSQAQALTKDK